MLETPEEIEHEIAAAMATLEAAPKAALVEALVSLAGTLGNLLDGQPDPGPEMELWACQMAAQFVNDNQAAGQEAEALDRLDPRKAAIN